MPAFEIRKGKCQMPVAQGCRPVAPCRFLTPLQKASALLSDSSVAFPGLLSSSMEISKYTDASGIPPRSQSKAGLSGNRQRHGAICCISLPRNHRRGKTIFFFPLYYHCRSSICPTWYEIGVVSQFEILALARLRARLTAVLIRKNKSTSGPSPGLRIRPTSAIHCGAGFFLMQSPQPISRLWYEPRFAGTTPHRRASRSLRVTKHDR